MHVDAQIVAAMILGISSLVAGILAVVMKLLFNGTGARVQRIELALDGHIVETREGFADMRQEHGSLVDTIHAISERVAGVEAAREDLMEALHTVSERVAGLEARRRT